MKLYTPFIIVLLIFTSNCKQNINHSNLVRIDVNDDYNTARNKFKTNLIKNSQTDLFQDELIKPPKQFYNLITYKSATGEEYSAYITPPPNDNRKHPVILYARGGQGGLSNWMWDPYFFMMPAVKDPNIVVMIPAWRGDNYQGKLELYLGEVDDALAAIEKLKSLPYVDSNNIYMMGHSTGGTTTQMTALASNDIKAAFSFGGITDVYEAYSGTDYDKAPFDINDEDEGYIRSLHNYIDELQTPLWFFEGEDENYVIKLAQKTEDKAKKAHSPFKVIPISGADHHSYVYDFIEKIVVPKINENSDFTKDATFNQKTINTILNSK